MPDLTRQVFFAVFSHAKAIPDGDECCEFEVKATTEQEREDFLDKDKDWFYIDKINDGK